MISLKTPKWQIDNIETVLFDKDGTFIDLHYFWGQMTKLRVQEIIKRFDLHYEYFEKLCFFLGYDVNNEKMLADGITALYSRSRIIEIFKSNLETLNIKTTEKELEEIFDYVSIKFYKGIEKYTKPIDSAIQFIDKLHSMGVKVGIVTSDSVKSTKLTLKQFGWEKYFDCVIGRESSPFTKESGEPTKLALKELSANPKTTIMIGDAPMDYISAKNAGIKNTILVASGQLNQKILLKTSTLAIEDLTEISLYYSKSTLDVHSLTFS